MNSLVIGGAGFIGSHLCDALIGRGDTVIALDNFLRGTKENICHLKSLDTFFFVEGDANDSDLVKNLILKHKVDYVYHLAANSDIQASSNDPSIEFQHTARTTWSVLIAMRETGLKKLFFSSTSAVYGEQGQNMNEESSLLLPISYYGSAKMASEAFIHSFSYMNDMDVLIFRFPNVVGRRLTHGVIFDFVSRLLKNPCKLDVLGNGKQQKQYIYVSDLVKAITSLDTANKGLNVYNVGDNSSSTVKFIAESVVRKMKLYECKIEYGQSEGGWKGDVPMFSYDLSKIHSLGWKASCSSDEAIEKTIDEHLTLIKYFEREIK